ncbi:Uncharacterised protein [Pseudomonas aeruginosa]|nr:Uncharacterized protein PA1840_5837 [Pseudomonas aeruginosa]QJE75528.1 Uncharacterized protein PA52Ts1_0568 [Pseudomonas aeruginosa]QJE81972.1 Uncharacterized protein PA52Ts2_0567 [Pseudomonas aeruginosa]QJE88355.1 Uncharacterized protein PA52Ts17_0563 [Pseudomonas aeruginosa]QLJ86474.1 Uncharacterized protein PA52Ts32_0578 [Pseudomonas aeruginosa]
MSKPFDMELFLAGVLIGSRATRQRHLRQAKLIQAEIADRWQRETPWAWQKNTYLGFLNIAYVDTVRRRDITTH